MSLELERIIETYAFEPLKNDLNKVQTVENVYIGVLGEFSSGKSSLINSILHKRILPAMDKPTTKSITYIKAESSQESEVEYFEILKDESEQKISLIEFQDIAKGNRAGESIVSVKTNEFLEKGYVFVDTPGVSSFDKMDTDITYGMLPKLDGVLICIDCNTGTLNSSLKTFLESPEIKLVKEKILFVLTRADDKINENSRQKIIDGFKVDIRKYLDIDDIDSRIILFSAHDYFEKNSTNSNEKLLELFDISINSRRNQMISQRLKTQEEILKNKVIDSLKDLKTKLNFDDSEFKVEKAKIEFDIENLKQERNNLNKKLSKFEDSLFDEVKSIGISVTAKIQSEFVNVTPDIKFLSEIYNQYTVDVNDLIVTSVERFFKHYQVVQAKNVSTDFSNLTSSINLIIKSKDTITAITTAAVIALATGGTSLAANAAEATAATGASLGAQAASKVAVGQTANFVAKEAGKIVVKHGLKTKLLQGIALLNNTIKEINPLEHAGAYLANLRIKSTTEIEVAQIGRKIVSNTITSIEEQISEVFNDMKERLNVSEGNLDTAYQGMKKGKEDVENTKKKIQDEIFKLS